MDVITWTDFSKYLIVAVCMSFVLYFKNYFKAVFIALFETSGPPAIPILGNALLLADNKRLNDVALHMYSLYGPIMRIWISIVPFFFLMEPSDLQIILSNNKYSVKSMFYSFLHNFIGKGLITDSGAKWKLNRKLIQPYFHKNMLKGFLNTFCNSSETLVDRCLTAEEDVNVIHFCNKLVLNVLQEAVLGIPLDQNLDNSPFRGSHVLISYRVTRPWLLLESVFQNTNISKDELNHTRQIRGFIRSILEKKKEQLNLKQTTKKNKCMMDMLIEISQKNEAFTEEDIINESSTFMLAGQESVATGLAFALYFIARYKDIQNKIVQELNEIFKECDKTVTYENVSKMKYLEQCIKEALRLCPSVPILSRQLTEDVYFGKILLPEGTNLLISPFVTHRLPHIFPDPLEYKPERFSAENVSKMHPYSYIPFSAGPRNCIGHQFALIEMKTVLANILRRFEISLVPGHEELNFSYRVTLRARGGIWLRLKKRIAVL